MKKKNQIIALLLVISLTFSITITTSIAASASTGGHSQSDAVSWANSQIDKSLDYDGAYGAQCVDLIAYYYQYLGTQTPGGNACDYTWNTLPSGWSRISNYTGFIPQPGDICVWGSYAKISSSYTLTEYGHIGIVTSGNSSTFNSIEQNVSGQYTQTCTNRGTSYVTCFIRPDFSDNNYVDLGTNFYAMITHLASWNHLTVENNYNVDICWENYSANQYWKFIRQSDGSYKIVSVSTGKCLDVLNSSSADGANIQVSDDNGLDAQRWYIYRCGNGYQIQAKCTKCVMEMNAWSFYQGVNLVSGTRDGSGAEIFAITKYDFNTVGKTSLNVSIDNGICQFYWDNARASTHHNIKVWYGSSVQPGEAPINYWNVQNNSYSVNLGGGTFTAYIESYNALGDYVQSSPITFNISAHTECRWNDGETTKEPTCTTTGTKIYTCTQCGKTKTETIPATGHKIVIDDAVPPTATESGLTQGEHCEVCGKVLIPQEIIKPLGINGDVDDDGKVTIKDSTAIQKHLANALVLDDKSLTLADANGDGIINISDSTQIQKYLVNLIEKLG